MRIKRSLYLKIKSIRESAIVNREWLANFEINRRTCAVRNLLPIADCRLPIADCRLPIAETKKPHLFSEA
jgi:hypothetical protein